MTLVVGFAPDRRGGAVLHLAGMLARSAHDGLVLCAVVPSPWPGASGQVDIELEPGFLVARSEHGERALTRLRRDRTCRPGMTVVRAYRLAGPGISREWAYAAMTRGRHQNRLYAARDPDDRQEFAPAPPEHRRTARSELVRALGTSQAEPLALERRHDRGPGIDR